MEADLSLELGFIIGLSSFGGTQRTQRAPKGRSDGPRPGDSSPRGDSADASAHTGLGKAELATACPPPTLARDQSAEATSQHMDFEFYGESLRSPLLLPPSVLSLATN